MSEKIDQVRVLKDDAGEWWLEFYANDIRYQVTIEDVINGLASFVNMQVTNAALHERVNDLEAAQQGVHPTALSGWEAVVFLVGLIGGLLIARFGGG